MSASFEPVFDRLRAILRRNAGAMKVADDTSARYCLQCGLHPKHKTPMPVAWVQTGKNYVSYHLMPVYGCPKLLDGVSKELKARMQGKSCFNFKTIDEPLFQELEQLTVAGLAAWKKAGFGAE
jgi:hypothetical protein